MSALARLELIGRIAVGGMAELLLGEWTSIEGFSKRVAVKRLHPELERHLDLVEAFVDEAKITARFNQSNLVSTIYFDAIGDRHHLLMDYVPGRDLASLAKVEREAKRPMGLASALWVGVGMLRGLDYAHRLTDASGELLGVIHRDVSPENVLVSCEGEIKVTDFGIALHRSKRFVTKRGVVKGKMNYLSPEQASGRPVDARADQFAAALVIDELIRGQPLYSGNDDASLLKLAQQAAYEAPAAMPPNLATIFHRALACSAADRFGSAGELADALQDFACGAGLVLSGRELAQALARSGAVRPEPLEQSEVRPVAQKTKPR